ncbi:SDR family NAD(P)-dependent oxidoreductase [Conexibacter woesei]|uniref:Short-chain dehydrogenase/reductase SDR n=1 Tax=Conexibacter woesei (strain DSM 14684 / CCUG 47730 / CIP 108061 / JCM 11494 / NBRC 100937 / ID131577) TaxID=469383 RepID=D3FCH9_CONWI|nr:SDR family oxidoreductase [Conexibacter woesei]ADB49452.1 short-chain dehydrogenase/reductase SDR [Conexibacter woesei DSM 14684]
MSDVTYPKRVVVTGAASGIGKATALILRARGSEVVAVDVNEAGLAAAAAAGCETVVCDIAQEDERARLHAAAGEVDGLVNGAGIIRVVAIPDVTDADWDAIFAVNVKALFFLARDFGLRMGEGAAIVNVASVSAKDNSTTEVLPYGSSKAAVHAITRGLANHLGPAGVRVNAVLPGIIDTPMQDNLVVDIAAIRGVDPAALHRQRLQTIALQNRAGSPEDTADVIAFLLSSAARYVTGQALAVDGGQIMQ